MSYDVVFWRGRPTAPPSRVWDALRAGDTVPFMMTVRRDDVAAALTAVFGNDVRIEGGSMMGPGWETGVDDGKHYIYVTCSWGIVEHPEALERLRRAMKRACLSMFDLQTSQYFEAPAFPEPASSVVHAPIDPPPFSAGDAVVHPTFGAGRVIRVEDGKIRTAFDSGEKVLLARFLQRA